MGNRVVAKSVLYVVLLLQLVSTIERQVFDFLGYMWMPILANFLNSVFVILGIFGVYQCRTPYVVAYMMWTLVWIAWNAFIVCFYLETGNLSRSQDLFSFGTGSYSWWMINGLGCNPEYFPANSSLELDDSRPYLPVKPTKVSGCLIEYEYVEVTHAAIQLIFAAIGFVSAMYLAHYFVTVVTPRRKKSHGDSSMYNIEYSAPQGNDSGCHNRAAAVQETDFYVESGDSRLHMTPRRVKRRSYTRNSTRSVGKLQHTQQPRGPSRSTRSLSRVTGAKALNPVTRLMERDDLRHKIVDSSTSNDDRVSHTQLAGQINLAFDAGSSRPNSSLYTVVNNNMANNGRELAASSITDYELSRPPSALTSYSNFHGQRRPLPQSNGMQNPKAMLTQEALNRNHAHNAEPAVNNSYDDLPPPPPPLSSSPTNVVMDTYNTALDSDSAQNSSISMPVPQQRGHPRKNEYVNMPVSEEPFQNGGMQQARFVQPQPAAVVNGSISSTASTAPSRDGPPSGPLPPPPPIRSHNYANSGFSYLPEPGLEPGPSVSGAKTRTSRYPDADVDNNDMATLRMDVRLNYQYSDLPDPLGPPVDRPEVQRHISIDYSQNNGAVKEERNGVAPPSRDRHLSAGQSRRDRSSSRPRNHEAPMVNGHKSGHHQAILNGPGLGGQAQVQNHMRRSRQDAEQQQPLRSGQKKGQVNGGGAIYYNDDDDYGFSQVQGQGNGAPDDKWYLHDSMRPVGAAQHGGNCKCYRCQRKLTAI